jgi:hypothetical protein
MMKKNIILLLCFSLFIFVGCQKNDDSSSSNPNNNGNNNTETKVQTTISIDVGDTGLDLNDDDYLVGGEGYETKAGNSVTLTGILEKTAVISVVSLKNEKIILEGIRYPGETNVEISLDSSAVMFVLTRPEFFGTKSTKPKELTKRIMSHPRFKELSTLIGEKIAEGSICPLDPGCNYPAQKISTQIAEEIDVSDLYE